MEIINNFGRKSLVFLIVIETSYSTCKSSLFSAIFCFSVEKFAFRDISSIFPAFYAVLASLNTLKKFHWINFLWSKIRQMTWIFWKICKYLKLILNFSNQPICFIFCTALPNIIYFNPYFYFFWENLRFRDINFL